MELQRIILAFFTALGAYGGFPNPPSWWKKITGFLIVRIACLWALIYQGGGNANLILTTIVTAIIFCAFNLPAILKATWGATKAVAGGVASATTTVASGVASGVSSAATGVSSAAKGVASGVSSAASTMATEEQII
jgi:type IV secretory pathway TrbL component